MLNYIPFEQAAQAGLPPAEDPMGGEAMLSPARYPMPAVIPQQPQFAPRLPADTLHKMYLSWEQAKDIEIHEQWIASRYYHAKQWTDAEVKALKRRKQPVTTKNRIKRKVDFLVGTEQRLRRDPKCYPRNPNAEAAAHVATAGLRFVEDVNQWQAIASECARDALIRGVGCQWAGVKMVKGQPEISKHHVPADRFFYDPRSERWDFSDARFLGEHQWLDIAEAREMLPYAADLIEQLADASMSGSLSALPQEFDKQKNWHPWVDHRQRRLRLISIWYKHNGQWMYDYLVGPVSLCPEGQHDCLSPYMDEDGNTVHPYEPWSPYVDERGDRYGVVRDMIPVQDEINKRSSKALHAITVRQTKSEKGAVEDIDKMKAELAKPDGHVEYNKGFVFDVIEQNTLIQGNLELLQEAKAEIENLGPNPGLIGRGVEQQSGRAILAQQNSGMTELSPVFERMREWKLKCYRRDWNLMKQFWTGERWVRITADPQAVQFLAVNKLVEDPITGQVYQENSIIDMDVDVVLDEGPDTVTMREELMEQLSQLGPEAVPAKVFIELSNINEKDRVIRMIDEATAPPPQMQAMAERMGHLEQMLKAADIDKKIADAESARATAAKAMAEAGIDPAIIRQVFPLQYREPTYLAQLAEANKLQPPGAPPGPAEGMLPNAMGGPPPALPAASPNPMAMDAPQLPLPMEG